MSISFDRAADYYDKTRGLPQEHSEALADLLAAEIGDSRCLEIGVGTGRIALPLYKRGTRLTGVDLSAPMLARLKANAGGQLPFPVLVADATRLPFHDASYDVLLASHVFHLIPDWRQAADEALRVVRPDGALLVDFGGGVNPPWRSLLEETLRDHGIQQTRPGVSSADEFAAHLGDRATMRRLPPLTLMVTRSLAQDLGDIERQIMSWSWSYPSDQVVAATADARRRAAEAGLDLEVPAELEYTLQFWAYDIAIA